VKQRLKLADKNGLTVLAVQHSLRLPGNLSLVQTFNLACRYFSLLLMREIMPKLRNGQAPLIVER
jgi:hypothetical protein